MSGIEAGKRAAAKQAVQDHLNTAMKYLGIGSGSTVVYAVEYIAEFARSNNVTFQCVPTSFQSKQLITANEPHLQLTDLDRCPVLDLDIDGADEVDSALNCIKGGGGCQTQEKVVAYAAKKFVVIADARKDSEVLCTQWKKGIPIEVVPMAASLVTRTLNSMRPGKANLRMAVSKAGPIVTDNGQFVIDWAIEGQLPVSEVDSLNRAIKQIPGVVETGLFVQMAEVAYFGQEDGSCKKRTKSQ